jgi:hypothetical protein
MAGRGQWQAMLVLAMVVLAGSAAGSFAPIIAGVDGYTLLRSSNRSSLYQVQSANQDYDTDVFFADLHGSRFQMGYDYGFLMHAEIQEAYTLFMNSVRGPALVPSRMKPPSRFAGGFFHPAGGKPHKQHGLERRGHSRH